MPTAEDYAIIASAAATTATAAADALNSASDALTAVGAELQAEAAASASAAAASASAAAGSAANSLTYATQSAGYRDTAATYLASVIASASSHNFYATKAAADAALAGLPANAYVHVLKDESLNNRWTIYQKISGSYTFVNYATPAMAWWYVDPRSGSDSNPGTPASPFATFEKAVSVSTFGDTIALVSGARVKFCDNIDNTTALGTYIVPDGVNVVGLGTRPMFNAFDKLTGSWTLETGTSYSKDFTSKFGNAAGAGGPGRIYPAAIYQTASGQDWRRIAWHYVNEYADLAAAKAYIDANVNHGLIYDTTGAGNFNTGWKRGVTHRIYVNVGADPSAYNWLVKQRQIPQFSHNHRLDNISFFGGIGHDGLVIRGSVMRDVEVAYPGFHGCEITGTSTENFTMREGPVPTAGYALHHFGASAQWYKQFRATHTGTKVFNWPGALWGLHGTDNADGGGGAGIVMNTLIHEDSLFQNVGSIGGVADAEFRRCVFNGYTAHGDSGDTIYSDCVFLQGAYRDHRNTGTGTLVAFQPPGTGFKTTLNNCQMVVTSSARFVGGATEFNRCRILMVNSGNVTFLQNFFPYTHDGVTVDSTVIQRVGGAQHIAAAPVAQSLSSSAPYTFRNSHIGGHYEGRGLSGVTVDEHTIFGGDAGIYPTDDVQSPIGVSPASSWRSLGERLLNSGGYFSRDLVFGTTRNVYSASLGSGYIPVNPGNNTWFASFATMLGSMTPRGVVAPDNGTSSTKVYVYGLAGKVYKNSGTSNSNAFSAVTTGLTNNFVGHLIDGQVIWLLGDDGSITKLDTATDTVTQPAAAGAVVSYQLRGGLVGTSGSKLIVFGGSDDGSTGGVLQSTDNGATWTAITVSSGSVPKTMRCAAKVNGVLVLAGGDGNLYTSTDVNVAFAPRTIKGLAGSFILSMAAETGLNQLVFALRGMPGIPNYYTGPMKGGIGFIDASNSDPSTWKARTKAAPFTPAYVAFNSKEFVGGSNVSASLMLVGQTGQMVAYTETGDSDWTIGGGYGVAGYSLASYSDGRNTQFAPQSFRMRDELGHFLA